MQIFQILITIFLLLLNNITYALENNLSNIGSSANVPTSKQQLNSQCLDIKSKNLLLSGWFWWEPYQFKHMTSAGYLLTGMDVELIKAIAAKVEVDIKYDQVDWQQHQQDLIQGKRDMAANSTFTEERAKDMYFSVPYRYEENSLYMMRDSVKNMSFRNITEFLAQTRLQNFRIGVTSGYTYGNLQLNEFINDEANSDIIIKYGNDAKSLQGLLRGEIDGFIADRIGGASAILNKAVDTKIREIALDIKIPIHIMFSKKTVPIEVVDRFNKEIKKFVGSSDYKVIIKNYLYPVLLLQTIDAEWFYIIGVIGTIAFAISGISIAAKENSTLFGTFLLAMLPSIGGGIMRDVMLNRSTIGIFLTPSYMYYILITVIIGFVTLRLLNYYNSQANEDNLVKKFWTNTLVICDALGQAAFIVTGVSIAIMAKIEPIELWGPFFAFLTSNGGGIIRDLIRKDREIICTNEEINAEISILWGLIFSTFLDINSTHPDPIVIKYTVILVVTGAFISKLLVHYLKIPNLRFRKL